MKMKRFCSMLAAVLLSGLLLNPSACAQFTGDYQTNIISGVTVDWTGTYAVGSNAVYDLLGIDGGGALISDAGAIGVIGVRAGNNAVTVTGTGSIWSNRNDLTIGNLIQGSIIHSSSANSLTIANGGAVYDVNATFNGSYNAAVVIGSGSVWHNSGTLAIGRNILELLNSLTVADGGTVIDDTGILGSADYAGGITALVTGIGSVWSNRNSLSVGGEGGNSLIISNGGAVYDGDGNVWGLQVNKVVVTGTGSVWNNHNALTIGGEFSPMTISSGGAAYSASGRILDSDRVLVTGAGSVWRIGDNLYLSSLANLTIADGGVVCASSLSSGGNIIVTGGGLYVTNGPGPGALQVNSNTLTLNDGTVTADSLSAVSINGHINFNGGMLSTKAMTISNGVVFTAGNGMNGATFILDSGGSGFHSFANGLTISSNATLKGTGTIIGNTLVNGGGVLSPGLSPGSITFSNCLTLAPNSTFAVELDGSAEGQYDRIVALDTVSLSNSILNVSLGFTPSAGDSFTIISNLSATAVLGTFVSTDGAALTDGAEFTVDGTTFEINYGANPNGQDVVLTALIPEPSSFLLTAVGALALWVILRRKNSSYCRPPL